MDEIQEKNNNFIKSNNQMYEPYTKINEISIIKIISKNKQDYKNFIIKFFIFFSLSNHQR